MSMVLVVNYMKRLKYILRHRYYIKIVALLFLLLVFIYTKVVKRQIIYNDETEFFGVIYKIKVKNDKTSIYIKAKERLIIETYSQINDELKLGDTIYVKGILTIPNNNTIPNIFNYRKYLYNNGIYHIVIATNIEKVANNTNVIYYLREKILTRINKNSTSSHYLKLFILGDNSSLDEDIINSYQQNGISHLFSISGMHISLFAGILLYFLKRLSYSNHYNYTVVILFLVFYALLVGFSPSVLRSLTMYILHAINKLFNLKIPRNNIMYITLIILLSINPFLIYHIAFQYSYIISLSLVLFAKNIKSIKNSILKSLYISYISFMVSIPICMYHFYKINILSIILNIVYIPLVSSIIFPLSLISFIVPKVDAILNIFIKIVETSSLFISKFKIGIVYFPKPNLIIIIILYIFIFALLYNKKNYIIFLLLFFYKNSIYFNNNYEIASLDVGQGDSAFIRFPRNKSNLLIDTGGRIDSNYKFTLNQTIPYLNSIGINHIDYLILTHGDYDHMGEAINLVINFKVKKVIFNCGEYNDLEKELIKVLDKKKIQYYSCIKQLNIDKFKLYFLQTKVYDNENDNSNVIYTELDRYKFMFMGDASTTTEHEILKEYNLTDIDVLKVGHHGSKTSSSIEFINEINPKYSIISVGKNNRYGHPNKETLDNLENSKIYRTDQDGSIMFKIKNNKLKVETCNP